MSFHFLHHQHLLLSVFLWDFCLFVCFFCFCLFSDNSYPCGCEVVDFLTL